MAVHVFLLVCGLSVAFLVYVLAQLWKEGRRPQDKTEPVMVFSRQWNPNVIVVTHPISFSAHGGISVMPLQPQSHSGGNPGQAAMNRSRVLEMPAKDRTGRLRSSARGTKTNVR